MAWTSDDIDRLKSALSEGVLIVEYADKKVEYRTLDEMLKILALMEQDVNGRRGGKVNQAYVTGL